MRLSELIQSRFPATRRFVNRRFDEQERLIKQIAEYQSEIIKIQDAQLSKHLRTDNDIKKIKSLLDSQQMTERWLRKRTPRAVPYFIAVHLTDHCNLNCKYCAHFAPIAKERYENIDNFERDMNRLSELYGGVLSQIYLMGGEPLLHPKASEFGRIARESFPSAYICYVTNGILLNTISDNFYKTCHEYKLAIRPTKYPINFDYEKAEQRAAYFGVEYEYFSDDTRSKTFRQDIYELRGNCDTELSFTNCHASNSCTVLLNGKIYPCPQAAYSYIFNNYFGNKLAQSKKDYIDIYTAKNSDEINSFLSHSIPFCRYCDVSARSYEHPFEVSRHRIEEYTK